MNNEATTDPKAESLDERAQMAMMSHQEVVLPGYAEYLIRDPKAAKWIAEQEAKIQSAVRDDDRALLDRGLNSWMRARERVNEILAEEYRLANPDATQWELRFLKWMAKVQYICFESPLGEFYVVPRMPERRPKVPHWYTVDEMLDMLHPTVAAAINRLGALPIRPEALPEAGPGDKILHFDATGPQVEMFYKFQGIKRGGKRLR